MYSYSRWTHHILKLGYEGRLDNVDIYDVLPDDSSIKLANDLGRSVFFNPAMLLVLDINLILLKLFTESS